MRKIFKTTNPAILLLLLTLAHLAYSSFPSCLTLRGQERDIIDARQMLNTEENVLNCMRLSIRKGRASQTRAIIDLYDKQYAEKMVSLLEKQLDRLETIEQQVIQGESSCAPVLKWSQNISHLFISMKMSHRWDSPPCLHTKSETTTLNSSSFEYTNICLVSHQKITFKTSLNFYYDVKENPVEVIKDGVGTYAATIEKAEYQVWPYLDKNEVVYSSWGEIAERYNPIHKQYLDMLDEITRDRQSKPSTLDTKKERKNVEDTTDSKSQEIDKKEADEVHKEETIPSDDNTESNAEDSQIEDEAPRAEQSDIIEKAEENSGTTQHSSEL